MQRHTTKQDSEKTTSSQQRKQTHYNSKTDRPCSWVFRLFQFIFILLAIGLSLSLVAYEKTQHNTWIEATSAAIAAATTSNVPVNTDPSSNTIDDSTIDDDTTNQTTLIHIPLSPPKKQTTEKAVLKEEDKIYRTRPPIVLEEYKLIFLPLPKAGSSVWVRFFMRLNNNSLWCAGGNAHGKKTNLLSRLNDYSLEQAQEMLTSPEWTKATFVRHPKLRVLSAYLDKMVTNQKHAMTVCTGLEKLGVNTTSCNKKDMNFDYFLYYVVSSDYVDAHWTPMWDLIEEKWWPHINFISNMEDVSGDSERLLRSVYSRTDNVTLWDRLGSTGWGDDIQDCRHAYGTNAFNARNIGGNHNQKTDLLLKEIYSHATEVFVETKYSDDLHNSYYSFSPIKIYPNGDEEGE